MTIKVLQDSTPAGHNWWNWSIWIDGTADEMKSIKEVIYTLHPTFSDPVRHVTNRRSKFKLESSGWGEFELCIEMLKTNGKSLSRKHWLELAPPVQKKTYRTLDAAQRKPKSNVKARTGKLMDKPGPTVFLSSGVADTEVMLALASALKAREFSVLSVEDLPAGVPWTKLIETATKRADVVIPVFSKHTSQWTLREAQHALGKTPMVPVILGEQVELPKEFQNMEFVKISSGHDVEVAAEEIVLSIAHMNKAITR